MEACHLPKTVKGFAEVFKGLTYLEVLKLSQNPDLLSTEQRIFWNYCEPAMKVGRALDSCVIFMGGASGSGKSSTINVLFEDETLCHVNRFESETGEPVLLRKRVCVLPPGEPPVVGYLSIIDVPGTLDTNEDHEVRNLASVQKFRKTMEELQTRKPSDKLGVRKDVFPNIILFTLKATDDRIKGPDSNFKKSLKALASMGLVDNKYPNLIIVLTSAAGLSLKSDKFQRNLQEKTKVVQEIVWEVLKIANVDVVPVENCGEDFDLQKIGDFYQLPNGEISHKNLFDLMQQVFLRNRDLIGRLCAGWYFRKDCPDKENPPEVIQFNGEIDQDDIETASDDLAKLKIIAQPKDSRSYFNFFKHDTSELAEEVKLGDILSSFNFQRLGYGYCPLTEEVRSVSLLHSKEKMKQKIAQVGSSKCLIPECIKVVENKFSIIQQASFMTKEEYQSHMKKSQDIDLKFEVNTGKIGRWIDNSTGKSSVVSFIYEIGIATLKLKLDKMDFNPKFLEHLKTLPETYTEENSNVFHAFFSRWGTHFVNEQVVGGALQLDYTLEPESVTEEKLKEFEGKLSDDLFGVEGNGMTELQTLDGNHAHLNFEGGNPLDPVSTEDIDLDKLKQWSQSVAENPIELCRRMKLYPYYEYLRSGPNQESLREATSMYLKGMLVLKTQNGERNQLSDKAMQDAIDSGKESNCFPKGTPIYIVNRQSRPIEKLERNLEMSTISLKGENIGKSWKLGKPTRTSFCTFLDRKDDELVEYLVLHMSNGKELAVSPAHMIFEYHPEKALVNGKQAKHFKLGDMLIYREADKSSLVEMPTVERISRRMDVGAYSPLTTTGTFFANGFLVSSYANVNYFAIAEAALFPLKAWCVLNGIMESRPNASEERNDEVAIQKDVIVSTPQGLHPYAKFLITLRKSVMCSRK